MIAQYEQKMFPGKYKETEHFSYIEYYGNHCTDLVSIDKLTICVTSKNRYNDFKRLSESLKFDGPKLVLTQGVAYNEPGWLEINVQSDDILPAYPIIKDRFGLSSSGCTLKNSLSWARNEIMSRAKTPWIICFDDDFSVKEDWLQYYIEVQNQSRSPIVMHNFGAFMLHYPTMRSTVYGIDERYINGSSGCEDEDFFARWLEANNMMVVGFNKEHTFDSTLRGSSTGYDSFTHHRSKTGGCRTVDPMGFDNQQWHWTKWHQTNIENGIQTRPPFKGWVERMVQEEIDWIGDYH